MIPVYKIEVYHGANLIHTITNTAIKVYSREVVTEGVGNFEIVVPTTFGLGDYKYNDIVLFDKVKIYYGYDAISGGATPNFVGRITRINGPLSTKQGFIRVMSGLSQGEILQRRFKKDKQWWTVDADSIITTLAQDLSIYDAAKIASDTTHVTMETVSRTYFDLIRQISDYWYDASHKVQKDFWVDADNELNWKARPVRTANVETLTVGTNILDYSVLQDIGNVKNAITAYGSMTGPDVKYPTDGDQYSEQNTTETPQDDGWDATISWGVSDPLPSPMVGSEYVRTASTGGTSVTGVWTLPTEQKCGNKGWNNLNFWVALRSSAPADLTLFTLALGKAGHQFVRSWSAKDIDPSGAGGWCTFDTSLGPDAGFTRVTIPDWNTIAFIQFQLNSSSSQTLRILIDGLHFYNRYYTGSASNGTSQSTYGQRDLEVTDGLLHSDADCAARAEAWLMQVKDAPVELEVTTHGNTNILVGDRLTITIPAENLSGASFDVVAVEHSISNAGFLTKARMIGTAATRLQAARGLTDLVAQQKRATQKLNQLQQNI